MASSKSLDATKDARIALDCVDGAVLVLVVGHAHPMAAFVGRAEHTLDAVDLPGEEDSRYPAPGATLPMPTS